MYFSRHIFFVICVLMCSAPGARAQHQLSDSLQQALAHTADPEDRVQLLLNLKDINEDSNLNLLIDPALPQGGPHPATPTPWP